MTFRSVTRRRAFAAARGACRRIHSGGRGLMCLVERTVSALGRTIMAAISSTGAGRAGEYWVAYQFELRGIEIYRVDGQFDLIANVGGRLTKLEVKSALSVRDASYSFFTPPRDIDEYALVALDIGLMRILTRDQIGRRMTTRIKPSEFSAEAQELDIADFLSRQACSTRNGGT